MKIFSIALNVHDHNTYDGYTHYQVERFSRLKHNLPKNFKMPWHFDKSKYKNKNNTTQSFFDNYFIKNNNDILCYTITKGALKFIDNFKFKKEFQNFIPKYLMDYEMIDNEYFIDHHQSHSIYSFFTSGFNKSDILTIDGNGFNFRSIFIKSNGQIIDLSNKIKIGILWNHFSKKLLFGHLGAGKLMGLVGYGSFNKDIYKLIYKMNKNINLIKTNIDYKLFKKEDIACTLQIFTNNIIKKLVFPLKTCNNICLSGGVAYNGYMNELFTTKYNKVHVPPAVGDEGQSLGTYIHANYNLNNIKHIPETYSGKKYNYIKNNIDLNYIAKQISNGKIIGWFQGRSESGNRSLGNRSILADPRRNDIKDIINIKIKKRENFRPFAPSVLEEYYNDYFDTNQPSPFMSRIVKVKSNKIPGVTHIDNTSRIQTVNEKQNKLFYDLINEFYKITGIPMLLNTSFNINEPIVESVNDAINTFNNSNIDLLIINNKIIKKC